MMISKDHPRVCGEQGQIVVTGGHLLGSPPRVRGTGFTIYTQHQTIRITPACAGNSIVHIALGWLGEDHPRVCGEQLFYN